MKHSHGNLIVTILPVLILASVAAAGWYSYYSEIKESESLAMDSRSVLEKLQTTINKLQEEEATLQARLVSGKKSQEEQASLLEKIMAEKMAMETDLRQEVNRVTSTTAELEAELERRRAVQNSLEQQAALIEKIKTEKNAMETVLQQEVNRVTSNTTELEEELEKRRAAQKSLNDQITVVSGEKSQLLTRLEQEQESKRQIENLKSRLEQELNESRIEISQLKNQMTVIKLTSEVLFSTGSAQIKPEGQKVLSIIAESLNAYPDREISVEGHTDNVPMLRKRLYKSNWELSTARGLAAVNYFQQNNQVDPKRLKVVGYGQYHPVSSNDTAEGRKLNRRIEIRILPPEAIHVNQN